MNDFWRMIFEHKCPTIVMLTTLKEMGKVKYKRLIASVKSQTKDVERLIHALVSVRFVAMFFLLLNMLQQHGLVN